MDMSYFRKLASAALSNPSGTYVGDISQSEKSPKWAGSFTNSAEFNQSVKPYKEGYFGQLRRGWAIPNPIPNSVDNYTPKVGEIDNRAYAQQPYKKTLDFDKINANRTQKQTLLPVQKGVSVVGAAGNGPQVSNAHYLVNGTSERVLQDAQGYLRNGEEKRQSLGTSAAYNGMETGYNPSARSTISHELNHVNNMPTASYKRLANGRQVVTPGFSKSTYANNPAEALQALASRKRAEAARGVDVSTPGAMEASLSRLSQVDPNSPANGEHLGEEQRLRNYLRTSMKDYDERAKQNPDLPKVSIPYRMGDTRGNPVFRNISNTYREAIPDLVQNRQPGRMDKIASTLNSSYNRLMNEGRMTKIAAALQKATDDLKLSDRPAGKRIQPPWVMSTPTSAELIRQKRENEGDCQAKQASRAAGKGLFRMLVEQA